MRGSPLHTYWKLLIGEVGIGLVVNVEKDCPVPRVFLRAVVSKGLLNEAGLVVTHGDCR